MASPPHVPQLNIPRKRGSISSNASTAKRRKPSQLRNAFSPDADAVGSPLRFSRSPSVDSVATGSMANGAGGRKRKRKDADTYSATGSLRNSKARSALAGAEGSVADGTNENEGGDDQDEDDEVEELTLQGSSTSEWTRKQEKEHERILLDAMNPDQERRFELYRRIRLKRETVRKLTNQTLSQSVPQNIVIAVTSYTKAFIGEIVDRALAVRDEWAASRTHIPNPNLPPALLRHAFTTTPKLHKPDAVTGFQEIQHAGLFPNQVPVGEGYWTEVGDQKGLEERLREEDKGPLTPAHLREALRRYKRDREGGGAGFAGMSLEGVERSLGRTGGRRLFR